MINVLFVDDDPNLLAGLRRAMYPQRDQWKMQFVDDPRKALDLFQTETFDVVVSDMRMPFMDGASLLQTVKEHSPQTIRMILSGQSEVSAAIRSIPVAHRFLTKPCDAELLKNAINAALALESRLGNDNLAELVGKIDVLPSLSKTIVELNDILGDPNATVADIGKIIESDTALTAKLLQLVNSAFFGLARNVSRIDDALSYVGVTTVRNTAAAVEIARAFQPQSPEGTKLVEELQAHALRVGTVAQELVPSSLANEAMIAGLLHDVGLLSVVTTMPNEISELTKAIAAGKRLVDVEKEILGASHADLGAYLLTLWGLPYSLVETVALHHDIDVMTRPEDDLARAIYIAEQTVNQQDDRTGGLAEGFDKF